MNNEQLMSAHKARNFHYFSPTPTEWAGGVCEAVETCFKLPASPPRGRTSIVRKISLNNYMARYYTSILSKQLYLCQANFQYFFKNFNFFEITLKIARQRRAQH